MKPTDVVVKQKIERTINALNKNNMQAVFAQDISEAREYLKGYLISGETVAVGGSMTLFESGVIDMLSGGEYNYLDRYDKSLDADGRGKIMRDAFFADSFVTSSNAITENGELYNVDCFGNRVAALMFGPKQVVVVAGYNKIVKNIDEAVARVRDYASPANSIRLEIETPCTKTGLCHNCSSPSRICCSYVVSSFQRVKDRIKVIIVGSELGY